MRRALALGVAMLFVTPVTASVVDAQTVGTVAPGTVELRLSATGQSVKPADQVTIYVPITTSGETAAAARSANSAAINAITNALVSRGIHRSAISLLPTASWFGFVGNEAYDPGTLQAPQGLAAILARKTARSALQIRLIDTALVNHVQEVLDQQNQTMSGPPVYSLNEDRAAKNEAIADAIAKVRQDADAYAAPLGLRVERITSVSSYGDATPSIPDVTLFASLMAGSREDEPNSVTTRVQVWVNFVLVPR